MAINNALNDNSSGIVVFSAGSFLGRTITGTANQIAVSNGDGIAGNPTLSLTTNIQVTGISFDAGSNSLTAYATGTFSPTLEGSTTNPVVGYTNQIGIYEKIGKKVFINLYLKISSISGGSGVIRIASMPFTSDATASSNSTGALVIENTSLASVNYAQADLGSNSTFYNPNRTLAANTVASLGITNLTSTSTFASNHYYNI